MQDKPIISRKPPGRSRNIFTDIKYFFLDKPPVSTLVKITSVEQKEIYCESILQRIGIRVSDYRMLNLHRIGVEAPASYLFDELLKWNGDSTC